MRQTLPWESVPPPIYVSRPPKPRKKWVTVGGWILVVLLLLFGLMSKRSNLPLSVISFGLALLYTLTLLTKKDAVVTTRGLEIFYQMQITTQYDFFPWEQINSIVTEDRKHPDLIRLHIGYSSMEKALFFTAPMRRPSSSWRRRKTPPSACWTMKPPRSRPPKNGKRNNAQRTAGVPAVLFHAPPAPQPSLFSAAFCSVCDSTAAQRRNIVIPHNITEKLTAIPIDFAQNLCYPKAINQTTPPLAESTHRQVRRTSWADVYRSTASGKSFSHHSIEIVPFGNY